MGGNNNKSWKSKFSECVEKEEERTKKRTRQTNKGSACIASVASLLYNKANEHCKTVSKYCTFVHAKKYAL